MKKTVSFNRYIAVLLGSLWLSACSVGPNYQRPAMELPAQFTSGGDWVAAAPADALDRGAWWTIFNDAFLNDLEAQVNVSNQNIAAAKAAYEQARGMVISQGAVLFPSVDLSGSAARNGAANTEPTQKYQVGIGTSWEPDVWGRLGRASAGAKASAQASEADLASARLSVQGELATNYFSIRQTDMQIHLLDATVTAYKRALQIAQNRFSAGATTQSDVLQAQTQLANTQADLLSLQRQREQLEHAIAVLVGKTPEAFHLPVDLGWQIHIPSVPIGVPSELLQRRPDIAAAERRVAVANEQIGIEKSGYFPRLTLSATDSQNAKSTATLWGSNANIWTVGATLAQTLFDAGATQGRVASAKAAHQQASAHYKQIVLNAFADIENQLTANRILVQQFVLRKQAADAASQVEQRALNRYREGQISYTDVVSAQTASLSATRALIQVQVDNMIAVTALIQALGGGWQVGA